MPLVTLPGSGDATSQVNAGVSIPALIGADGVPVAIRCTRANSTAYEASRIIKASGGILLSIMGYNSGPAQFIQLHDSATLPADTAVPEVVIAVPALSNFSIDVPVSGIPFTAGVLVCNSSTGPTKTIGSANCYFAAVYI